MEDAPAVIPPVSAHSGGFSHLQQHNPAARPFLHADGFTARHIPVSYPPVPKTRAGRTDDTIYFNHATQRPERWNVSAKLFFCVCDLNPSVPSMEYELSGDQISKHSIVPAPRHCPSNVLLQSTLSQMPRSRHCPINAVLQ